MSPYVSRGVAAVAEAVAARAVMAAAVAKRHADGRRSLNIHGHKKFTLDLTTTFRTPQGSHDKQSPAAHCTLTSR